MSKNSRGEKTLRQIEHWEKKHLRSHTKVNYALSLDLLKTGDLDSDYRRCLLIREYTFVSDSARTFPLGTFGETVKDWTDKAAREIEIFHERQAMRGKLDKIQRADSLFDQMEQLFYDLMSQFLHAVSFFQYDRINNEAYREAGTGQIMRILVRGAQLLEYYGSYLSLQSAAAFSEPVDEIGNIRIAVEAMQDALRQTGEV